MTKNILKKLIKRCILEFKEIDNRITIPGYGVLDEKHVISSIEQYLNKALTLLKDGNYNTLDRLVGIKNDGVLSNMVTSLKKFHDENSNL